MSKQQSLTDKAYDYIKEQILLQVFVPGVPLNEGQIAAQLAMSRTPIHDAVKRLELEGLVEVLPRRGTFIKHLTAGELELYYEVCEGLEGMLAYNVAQQVREGRLPAEKLGELAKLVDDMDRYYEGNDPKMWVNSDEAFHAALQSLCDNPVLTGYLERVQTHFNCVQWFITPKYVDRKISNQEHRLLCEYLMAGDAEAARDVAQKQRARVRLEIKNYR